MVPPRISRNRVPPGSVDPIPERTRPEAPPEETPPVEPRRDGARDAADLSETEASREDAGIGEGRTRGPRDRFREEMRRYEALRSSDPDAAGRILRETLPPLAREITESLRSQPRELVEDLRMLRSLHRARLDFERAHAPTRRLFGNEAYEAYERRTQTISGELSGVEGALRALRDLLRGRLYVPPGGRPTPSQLSDAHLAADISRDLGEYAYLRDDLRSWTRILRSADSSTARPEDLAAESLALLQGWSALRDAALGRIDRGPYPAPLEMNADQITDEMRTARDLVVEPLSGNPDIDVDMVRAHLDRLIDNDQHREIGELNLESLVEAATARSELAALLHRAEGVEDLAARRGLLLSGLQSAVSLGDPVEISRVLRALESALPAEGEAGRSLARLEMLTQAYSTLRGGDFTAAGRIRRELEALAGTFRGPDSGLSALDRARGMTLARSFFLSIGESTQASAFNRPMRDLREELRAELRGARDRMPPEEYADSCRVLAELSLGLTTISETEIGISEREIYDRMIAEARGRGEDVSWSFQQRAVRERARAEAVRTYGEGLSRDMAQWLIAAARLRRADPAVPLSTRIEHGRALALAMRGLREIEVDGNPLIAESTMANSARLTEELLGGVFEDALIQRDGPGLEERRELAGRISADLNARVHAAMGAEASSEDIAWLGSLTSESAREFAEISQSAHLLMRGHETPPSERDLQACLQAAQLFASLRLPDRVSEAMAPLETFAAGLDVSDAAQAGTRAQLLMSLAQIYSSAGMSDRLRGTLEGVVALDRPGELHDVAELARGMIHMSEGRLEDAREIFVNLPDNPVAQSFLQSILNGERGARIARTVAVLRAVSANFLQRGRDAGEDMDAWERDTNAGWDEVQRLLITGECTSIFDALRRIEESGRFPGFHTGAGDMTIGSQIQYFMAEVDNPALSDADFAESIFNFASRISADGYLMADGMIYQMLAEDPRYHDRATERLESIPGLARFQAGLNIGRMLLAMRAGPAGMLGISMTSGSSPDEVITNTAMVIVPFAAARAVAVGAEGLFVARATGGSVRAIRTAEAVERSYLAVEAGGRSVRGLRMAGFGVRATTEATVFTVSSMGLHSLFTGNTANWTWGNFGREFGAMLLTFGLCHGIGLGMGRLGREAARFEGLRRTGVSAELGAAALRPGAARAMGVLSYGATIGGLTGLEYFNEAIGLHPHEGEVPFLIRLFNSAMMDAQMRVAGHGIDAVSGGRLSRFEASTHRAYDVAEVMPALRRLGFEGPNERGEISPESRLILDTMMSRIAAGESPSAVEASMDATARRSFARAVRERMGMDPESPEGRQFTALLYAHVYRPGRSPEGSRAVLEHLPESLAAYRRSSETFLREIGIASGPRFEALRTAILSEALREGRSPSEVAELLVESGDFGDRVRSIVNGALGPRSSASPEGQALIAALTLRAIDGGNFENIGNRYSALAEAMPGVEAALGRGLDSLGELSPAARRRLAATLLLRAASEGGENAGAITHVAESFAEGAGRLRDGTERIADMLNYGGEAARADLLAWAVGEGLTPGALRGIARRVEEGRLTLALREGRVSVEEVSAERQAAQREAVAEHLAARERERSGVVEAVAERGERELPGEAALPRAARGTRVSEIPVEPLVEAPAEGEAPPARADFFSAQIGTARELAREAGRGEDRAFLGSLAILLTTTLRGAEGGFPHAEARQSFLRARTREARELLEAAGLGENAALRRSLADLLVRTMRGAERGFTPAAEGEAALPPPAESRDLQRHFLAQLAGASRLLHAGASAPTFFRALAAEVEAGRLTVDAEAVERVTEIFSHEATIRALDRVPLDQRIEVRQALLFEILAGRVTRTRGIADRIFEMREAPARFDGIRMGGGERPETIRPELLPRIGEGSEGHEILERFGFAQGTDGPMMRAWTRSRIALEQLADPGQPAGPLVNLARRTRGALETAYEAAREIESLSGRTPPPAELETARARLAEATRTLEAWEALQPTWHRAFEEGEALESAAHRPYFSLRLALEPSAREVARTDRVLAPEEGPERTYEPGAVLESTGASTNPMRAVDERILSVDSWVPEGGELADAWLDPARGDQGRSPIRAGEVTLVVREAADISPVADAALARLGEVEIFRGVEPSTLRIERSSEENGSTRLEIADPASPNLRFVVRVVEERVAHAERSEAEAAFERASRFEAAAIPIPELRAAPEVEAPAAADPRREVRTVRPGARREAPPPAEEGTRPGTPQRIAELASTDPEAPSEVRPTVRPPRRAPEAEAPAEGVSRVTPLTPPPGSEVADTPVIPGPARLPEAGLEMRSHVDVRLVELAFPEGYARPSFTEFTPTAEARDIAGRLEESGHGELARALREDLATLESAAHDSPPFEAAIQRLGSVLRTKYVEAEFSRTPVPFMGEAMFGRFAAEIQSLYRSGEGTVESGVRRNSRGRAEASELESTATGTHGPGGLSPERSTVRPLPEAPVRREPVSEIVRRAGGEAPIPPLPTEGPIGEAVARGTRLEGGDSPLAPHARRALERLRGTREGTPEFREALAEIETLTEIANTTELRLPESGHPSREAARAFRDLAVSTRDALAGAEPGSAAYAETVANYRTRRDAIGHELAEAHRPAMESVLSFLGEVGTGGEAWAEVHERHPFLEAPRFAEDIPPHGRIKADSEVLSKLNRRGWTSLEPMTDFAGTRAVVESYEDVMPLVAAIQARYTLREVRDGAGETTLRRGRAEIDRDGIRRLIAGNRSGYRAIHVVVEVEGRPVEIQIQTRAMYEWGQIQHDLVYSVVRARGAEAGEVPAYALPSEVRSSIDAYCQEAARYLSDLEVGAVPAERPSADGVMRSLPTDMPAAVQERLRAELTRMDDLMVETRRHFLGEEAAEEPAGVVIPFPRRRPAEIEESPVARAAGPELAPEIDPASARPSPLPEGFDRPAFDRSVQSLLESRFAELLEAQDLAPLRAYSEARARGEEPSAEMSAAALDAFHYDTTVTGTDGRPSSGGLLRIPLTPPPEGNPYRAEIVSVDAASGSVTIRVRGGHERTLRGIVAGAPPFRPGQIVQYLPPIAGASGPAFHMTPPTAEAPGEIRPMPGAQSFTVGRGHGSVADPAMSANHAVFRRGEDGRWTVEDLNSTNGLHILGPDGRPLRVPPGRTVALQEGSMLHVGTHWYTFRTPIESGRILPVMELRGGVPEAPIVAPPPGASRFSLFGLTVERAGDHWYAVSGETRIRINGQGHSGTVPLREGDVLEVAGRSFRFQPEVALREYGRDVESLSVPNMRNVIGRGELSSVTGGRLLANGGTVELSLTQVHSRGAGEAHQVASVLRLPRSVAEELGFRFDGRGALSLAESPRSLVLVAPPPPERTYPAPEVVTLPDPMAIRGGPYRESGGTPRVELAAPVDQAGNVYSIALAGRTMPASGLPSMIGHPLRTEFHPDGTAYVTFEGRVRGESASRRVILRLDSERARSLELGRADRPGREYLIVLRSSARPAEEAAPPAPREAPPPPPPPAPVACSDGHAYEIRPSGQTVQRPGAVMEFPEGSLPTHIGTGARLLPSTSDGRIHIAMELLDVHDRNSQRTVRISLSREEALRIGVLRPDGHLASGNIGLHRVGEALPPAGSEGTPPPPGSVRFGDRGPSEFSFGRETTGDSADLTVASEMRMVSRRQARFRHGEGGLEIRAEAVEGTWILHEGRWRELHTADGWIPLPEGSRIAFGRPAGIDASTGRRSAPPDRASEHLIEMEIGAGSVLRAAPEAGLHWSPPARAPRPAGPAEAPALSGEEGIVLLPDGARYEIRGPDPAAERGAAGRIRFHAYHGEGLEVIGSSGETLTFRARLRDIRELMAGRESQSSATFSMPRSEAVARRLIDAEGRVLASSFSLEIPRRPNAEALSRAELPTRADGSIDLAALPGVLGAGVADPAWRAHAIENLGGIAAGGSEGRGYSDHNEDRYVVFSTPEGRSVTVVIDGMGGHGGGERAASIARAVIQRALERGVPVDQALELAHAAMVQDNAERRSDSGAVAASVEIRPSGEGDYVVEMRRIGDSDAAAFDLTRGSETPIVGRTERHSEGETRELRLTSGSAVNSAMGLSQRGPQETTSLRLRDGQVLLVGSDGFWENFIDYAEVREVMMRSPDRSAEGLRAALMTEVQVRQRLLEMRGRGTEAWTITPERYARAYREVTGQAPPSYPPWRYLGGTLERNGRVLDTAGRGIGRFKADNVTLVVQVVGEPVTRPTYRDRPAEVPEADRLPRAADDELRPEGVEAMPALEESIPALIALGVPGAEPGHRGSEHPFLVTGPETRDGAQFYQMTLDEAGAPVHVPNRLEVRSPVALSGTALENVLGPTHREARVELSAIYGERIPLSDLPNGGSSAPVVDFYAVADAEAAARVRSPEHPSVAIADPAAAAEGPLFAMVRQTGGAWRLMLQGEGVRVLDASGAAHPPVPGNPRAYELRAGDRVHLGLTELVFDGRSFRSEVTTETRVRIPAGDFR